MIDLDVLVYIRLEKTLALKHKHTASSRNGSAPAQVQT